MSTPAEAKPLIQMIDTNEYKKLAATLEQATAADILEALNHAHGKNLLPAFAAYVIAYGGATIDKEDKILVGKKPEADFATALNKNLETFISALKKGLKYCGFSRDQLEFTRDSLVAAAKHGKFDNPEVVASAYGDILLIMAALKRLETTSSSGAAKFAGASGSAPTISLVVMEAWRGHSSQQK